MEYYKQIRKNSSEMRRKHLKLRTKKTHHKLGAGQAEQPIPRHILVKLFEEKKKNYFRHLDKNTGHLKMVGGGADYQTTAEGGRLTHTRHSRKVTGAFTSRQSELQVHR